MPKPPHITSLDGLPDETWITLRDVAAILSVHYTSAYEIVTTGGMPFVRLGRRIRVKVGDLRAFLESRRVPRSPLHPFH